MSNSCPNHWEGRNEVATQISESIDDVDLMLKSRTESVKSKGFVDTDNVMDSDRKSYVLLYIYYVII